MYRHLVACCPIAICIYFDTNKICLNQILIFHIFAKFELLGHWGGSERFEQTGKSALTSCTIRVSEISTLYHEIVNNPVEYTLVIAISLVEITEKMIQKVKYVSLLAGS